VEGRGGDDEVLPRRGVARFPALFNREPPPEHDVVGDRYPPEQRPDFVREPAGHFGPPIGLFNKFNPESDLRKRYLADGRARRVPIPR
jgi:hypothetical protein